MKKIIFKNREEFKWNGRTYDFIASEENDEEITKEEFEKLNIIDDIDKLKNYDNNTNYIIIDCYYLVEAENDEIEILGYDTESAEFTRGVLKMNKVKKIILDDLKLTEKQKKELEKIKKYLEKENQKAREHQKERGVG